MALSRKRKIIIGSSIGVLLLIIIIGSIFATRTDTPEVTAVKIEVRPELKSTVTSSGEVRPIQFVNLTSEVQGKIEEITRKEGDAVEKGEILVRLDPNQLESNADAQFAAYQSAQDDIRSSQSQVAAAQNAHAQAQQSLNQAQVAVENARQGVVTAQTDVDGAQNKLNQAQRELKRSEQLLESGAIPRLEYDQAKDKVDDATVGLNSARARLEAARISIKDSQARLASQQVAVRD